MGKTKTNDSWIRLSLIVVPVPFIVMIWAMWYFDFFVFTGSEANAKIVGTALTLGGGLVATMVTLIGLVLRHSTEKRNADLRDEAEKRLKLEAAIRAVDLLGTSEGKDSSETQRTGALYSLAHLGSIDLAVDLVYIMRPAGLIGPGATVSVLDLALRYEDQRVQISAAGFLDRHFETLLTEEAFAWPKYIMYNWPSELSYPAKRHVIRGLIRMILARPKRKWNKINLYGFTAILAIALRCEEDKRLKASIALYLDRILLTQSRYVTYYLHNENLNSKTIRKYISETDTKHASGESRELTARLSKWVDESEEKTDSNLT